MKLLSLRVEHFGCVRQAAVELAPGLNVLYGPNDLGKSTLARAIRAALLLPHTSSAAGDYISWDSGESPSVTLTLELPDRRIWRIEKRFGGTGRKAVLRESSDGATFSERSRGREVDDEIRTALGWGITAPGGKGSPRGLPTSFLSTVLLGEQTDVAQVLRQTIEADYDESGKARLTAALAAFAEDPLFKRILESAQARVGEAFTPTGRKRSGRASPFREVTEEVKRVKEYLDQIRQRVRESEDAERELEARHADLGRRQEIVDQAIERRDAIRVDLGRLEARQTIEHELASARAILESEQAQLDALAQREARRAELGTLVAAAMSARDDLRTEHTRRVARHREAEDALRRATSAEAEQTRHSPRRAREATARAGRPAQGARRR